DAAGARPAAPALARALKRYCFAHGLIVETGGRHGAVVRLLPPLTVSAAELDLAFDTLDAGLAALGEHARAEFA
ncbi:diaminobutyrate--2-oxoglutarate transaminase, partial [Burkholderia pseudomallei]